MLLLQHGFSLHDSGLGLRSEHKGQLAEGHQLCLAGGPLPPVLLLLLLLHTHHTSVNQLTCPNLYQLSLMFALAS